MLKVIIMRPIAEEILHLDFLYPPASLLIHRIDIRKRIAFIVQGYLLVLRHECHILFVVVHGIGIVLPIIVDFGYLLEQGVLLGVRISLLHDLNLFIRIGLGMEAITFQQTIVQASHHTIRRYHDIECLVHVRHTLFLP